MLSASSSSRWVNPVRGDIEAIMAISEQSRRTKEGMSVLQDVWGQSEGCASYRW
jgi:hypothetical protein